jgi:hypothetical protein
MQMPELRVPELTRRQAIALVVVVAGVVAIGLAMFAGSGSDGATPDSSRNNEAIDPVEPIDPDDADADDPKDLKDSINPLSPLADPFATSFGGNFKHKVTVRVSADSALRYGVRFRDGYETDKIVQGGATITRTVKGGFPLAQVGMRTAPNSTRGSCSISIDGVEVSGHTTHKSLGVVVCTG